MKSLLLALLFAVKLIPVYYLPSVTPEQKEAAEDAVCRAWGYYREATGDGDTAAIIETTDWRKAEVIVQTGWVGGPVAWALPRGHWDRPSVRVSAAGLAKHREKVRAQVICHELMHLYHDLPDEYCYDALRRPCAQAKHCIMGNFVAFGWTGKLCPECQAKVKLLPRPE